MSFSLPLSLLLLLAVSLPVYAAGADATEGRAERPKLPAVKLAPKPRESAPRPDDSGKMKRVPPPRDESPLQHVPALMDPPPAPTPPKP